MPKQRPVTIAAPPALHADLDAFTSRLTVLDDVALVTLLTTLEL